MLAQTRDFEIRAALHKKKFCVYNANPEIIVVDELGLSHAKVRIDVAVINGCVHGYEIKSSLDNLDRLPQQLDLYKRCLEKLTIVSAPRHIDHIAALAPGWCGIIQADKGARGGIKFETIRRGMNNCEIEPVQLAHLLWREEAIKLLERYDLEAKFRNKPRKVLYEALVELMTVTQLTQAIKEFMQQRQGWRYRPIPA